MTALARVWLLLRARLLGHSRREVDLLLGRARATKALAALVRTGLPPRAALGAWAREVPGGELGAALQDLARRLDLGQETRLAVARLDTVMGADAHSVGSALALAGRLGGDLAAMLDRLADGMEERLQAARAARAASAGAMLSGRVVAGLPLAFLPLSPLAPGPLLDAAGVALIVAGVGLAAVGMRWMARLVPRHCGTDDGVAFAAEMIAALTHGGVSLELALAEVASDPPEQLREPLGRARALTALGVSWAEALERSGDDSLAALAPVVAEATAKGLPVAGALASFAARRRADVEVSYEEELRRAPVLMVVPLVVCVLPSFILLALVPLLRGLPAS